MRLPDGMLSACLRKSGLNMVGVLSHKTLIVCGVRVVCMVVIGSWLGCVLGRPEDVFTEGKEREEVVECKLIVIGAGRNQK